MMGFMKPAPHVARLPADRIDAEYKRLRMQVFWGTFLGYATYYLLRKNFSLAMPYIVEESGYTKAQLGIVLTMLSIAYGFSKFVMGNVSQQPQVLRHHRPAAQRHDLPGIWPGAGRAQQHSHHVHAQLPQRLVPGHGLPPVRTDHGALVLHQ